jgi:hypothetical protein
VAPSAIDPEKSKPSMEELATTNNFPDGSDLMASVVAAVLRAAASELLVVPEHWVITSAATAKSDTAVVAAIATVRGVNRRERRNEGMVRPCRRIRAQDVTVTVADPSSVLVLPPFALMAYT